MNKGAALKINEDFGDSQSIDLSLTPPKINIFITFDMRLSSLFKQKS